ncbi:fructose-1,6-bisphosphate aldolase [Thiohalobacter thiocyanaticus]|uniref:Probable fructose-bisphosphate aldolase class 1 n=1 Tax=Thiohalobacter thiocyanaticus TaxID=585455 RepID=A0A1Z4VRM2_9GAMM|nr:class I fructose-bisphosphate aldolase [Thiohalobacter thiocyanaticus]BAZ94276.1 fructose-1,6-bisphosphate aldolase [Thiohalobacter thiocyanaticus]
MNTPSLRETARAMVAPGKGILAMDESTPTCGKRLEAVGVENTEENRIAYRSLLLGTPGLGDYISGAILYDETLRQQSAEGVSFPQLLQQQGIMPGIKVDTGAKELALHAGEKVTEGLDGLRERLEEYRGFGARFCKWRAVITIGEFKPSIACLQANAHALARYAALCQEAGLVPIVEPEVLINGAHTLETSYDVTVETQRRVFDQLYRQDVDFAGMVLKPSMVISGTDCPQRAPMEEVAEQTLRCLQQTVPAAVPGIAFLSGGQGDEEATRHLNAMNLLARERALPWRLTFSFARALQNPALKIWQGEPANLDPARKALLARARLNALASSGEYNEALEQQVAA